METVKIDGVEIPIEKLEKAGFKKVEPELKLEGRYIICGDSEIASTVSYRVTNYLNYGSSFPTREEAEEAIKRRRPANLLDCWITHFEREMGKPNLDWKNYTQPKFTIYYDWRKEKYIVSNWNAFQYIGLRYTTKEVAHKICDLLNKGKISIGEL